MTRTDDEILEFIKENGSGTPSAIADVVDRNRNYINRRCSKLTEAGFLNRPSRGFYSLTDRGERYLEGELDADDLPGTDD